MAEIGPQQWEGFLSFLDSTRSHSKLLSTYFDGPETLTSFTIMPSTRISILGSGVVAPPCVEYLLRNERNIMTVV